MEERETAVVKFQWDEANVAHIARHDVTPAEAEEVTRARPMRVSEERRNGELRINLLGATSSGRVLVVVVTPRGEEIRVVTCFPADRALRRLFADHLSQRTKTHD